MFLTPMCPVTFHWNNDGMTSDLDRKKRHLVQRRKKEARTKFSCVTLDFSEIFAGLFHSAMKHIFFDHKITR